MKIFTTFVASATLLASAAVAQEKTALEIAREMDACDGREVLAAKFLDDGRIQVRCSDEAIAADGNGGNVPTNNVNPLVGDLGPVLGALGLAAVAAAAAGGGSSTSDTQ
ncbi:hypothetical protein [Aestuariicoccus sp. MJ-SS9]|uniref:hypothetical protein n=1 Tax=Aestuariicoccus sp. MJ-SS9 TaxID=3079855 RepID=UPI002909959C|nr:hypothetical protein [Aestuariicoccus sp. MJ-SS9]MDU8914014.1 hypothetical protein [Aestuariicoccus sp. MJ-SS9]